MGKERFEQESDKGLFDQDLGRRGFLESLAIAGVVLASCSGGGGEATAPSGFTPREKVALGPTTAPDGQPLRAGLVGCGGRGTGAALNFLAAGPNLEIVALADLFEDRIERCQNLLSEEAGVTVPADRVHVGFDSYQQLLDSDIDVVLLATPPHFRPEHFAAAVRARKHVFMEKPVAVDPVGVRSVIDSAERASAMDLRVVTGTNYRHTPSYIETYNQLADGAIGRIVAARGYSLRGALWYREPREEWSEMEAMIRDWVNWNWLSGDFVVEQHIHGLDALFWFTGGYPLRSIAMGGRARRVTGDQYDFFSIDYELENGVHIQSMSRQIDGCVNDISQWIIGTRGFTNCQDTIFNLQGEPVWKSEGEGERSSYVQEHVNLVTAIRNGEPLNQAEVTAKSTLGAIMGRESAYTGLEVTWDQMMESEMRLGPTEYEFGPVGIEATVPVPGSES